MKKITLSILMLMLFAGCVMTRVSPARSSWAGLYESRIDLFVVEHGGRYFLALPDSEDFPTKAYNAAPTVAAWRATPEAFPQVKDAILSGTKVQIKSVQRSDGFAVGFGFVSSVDVLAIAEGCTLNPLDAGELIVYSEEGEIIGVKLKYLRKIEQE